jgi:hypothetical protein
MQVSHGILQVRGNSLQVSPVILQVSGIILQVNAVRPHGARHRLRQIAGVLHRTTLRMRPTAVLMPVAVIPLRRGPDVTR